MADRLIDLKELRSLIGYGEKKIRAMVAEGELPAPLIGGRERQKQKWSYLTIQNWIARGCKPNCRKRRVTS